MIVEVNVTSNWLFTYLVEYVTPYWRTLVLAIVLMLGESAVSLISPWLAGRFTESLLATEIESHFSYQQILLLWLAVLAIQGLLSFSNRFLVGNTGEKMLARLRMRLYDHLQALPLGYFHERKQGEVLALMTNDIYILGNFVTGTLISLLPHLVTFFGAFILIFLINPFLGLLIGLLLPFFFLIIKLLGRHIRPVSKAIIDQYAGTIAIVEENLQLLPIIKSFTREEVESKRFQQGSLRLLDLSARYLWIQSMLTPLVHFLAASAILLLLWISSVQLASNQMSIADMISLLLYGMLLTRPLSSLADVYGQVQRTRGATERLVEFFNIEQEPADTGTIVLTRVRGKIEFRDVHFAYPGRDKTLCALNLKIEEGETVAITGRNGVGKSTLAYLLNRFSDPQQGKILIDDIDIVSVSLSSLRRQIGMVQQQVLLLNGTIGENIAFGYPDAEQEEIMAAARLAHAIEFIRKLPGSFDTLIGDQGIKLSGGQKQRLALARALLRDPPIIVLDEATAMFDPEGEKGFIQECHELLHQRTVILITHRPASLELADRVLELDQGKIK